MTTTLLDLPATTDTHGGARVTQRTVTRAEWIKFRSVRSNLIALVASGALLVAFGTLFSSIVGSGQAFGPDQTAGTDSLTISFSGINVSQLVLACLGAVFIAGEYSTGMIRTMFASVADRTKVLIGKAAVLAGGSWVVMTLASIVVFFTGKAVYSGQGTVSSLGDPGVLRAVLGGGVFGAGIVVMGLALGFLLRSTAAAIGTLIGVLMVAPALVGLLPGSLGDTLAKILPSNAGQAFMSVSHSSTLLSPGAGAAVFVAWAVGLLGAAIVVLRRRDA
jgi:ABC-type transport system involved in multi-copper enzyme maturation permease subunit